MLLGFMLRSHCLAPFMVAVLLGLVTGCAAPQPIGLIGNDEARTVAVVEAHTGVLKATLRVPASGDRDVFALALSPSGQTAFVSDRMGQVVRLARDNDSLAIDGPPFRPSHTAAALAVSASRRPVLIAVGTDTASVAGVVSVLDPAQGTEIDRHSLGESTPYAVDVCDDDATVLVATATPHAVHKLTLDARGRLTHTEALVEVNQPIANVYCAPGSRTGTIVTSAGATLHAFNVESMTTVTTRNLAAQSAEPVATPLGLSGVFAPDGSRFFVRSERGDFGGVGFVEAFDFDAATGSLGFDPQRTRVAPTATASRGTNALAISPDGTRLYVTDTHRDRMLVLDPATLSSIETLSDTGLDGPFGIVVSDEF